MRKIDIYTYVHSYVYSSLNEVFENKSLCGFSKKKNTRSYVCMHVAISKETLSADFLYPACPCTATPARSITHA